MGCVIEYGAGRLDCTEARMNGALALVQHWVKLVSPSQANMKVALNLAFSVSEARFRIPL